MKVLEQDNLRLKRNCGGARSGIGVLTNLQREIGKPAPATGSRGISAVQAQGLGDLESSLAVVDKVKVPAEHEDITPGQLARA